ncbi:MAG: hypothetical protein WC243_02555 [Patescibacteria group bacterium]|jgi:hypothetical protein
MLKSQNLWKEREIEVANSEKENLRNDMVVELVAFMMGHPGIPTESILDEEVPGDLGAYVRQLVGGNRLDFLGDAEKRKQVMKAC